MKEVDRLGWAVTVPLRAGQYVLGVRVNSAESAAMLRSVFADRVVDHADPPGNLSLWLSPRSTDGVQELHRLFWNCRSFLRTRAVRRVVGALWHHFEARDARLAGVTPLVDATVLVADDRAHLLSANWRQYFVDNERPWSREGFRLIDRPWPAVDLGRGTIAIEHPGFTAEDEAAFRRLIDGSRIDDRDAVLPASGSLRIASWTLTARETTTATKVVLAAGHVLDLKDHGAPLVHQLVELMGTMPHTSPGWKEPDELRSLLRAL